MNRYTWGDTPDPSEQPDHCEDCGGTGQLKMLAPEVERWSCGVRRVARRHVTQLVKCKACDGSGRKRKMVVRGRNAVLRLNGYEVPFFSSFAGALGIETITLTGDAEALERARGADAPAEPERAAKDALAELQSKPEQDVATGEPVWMPADVTMTIQPSSGPTEAPSGGAIRCTLNGRDVTVEEFCNRALAEPQTPVEVTYESFEPAEPERKPSVGWLTFGGANIHCQRGTWDAGVARVERLGAEHRRKWRALAFPPHSDAEQEAWRYGDFDDLDEAKLAAEGGLAKLQAEAEPEKCGSCATFHVNRCSRLDIMVAPLDPACDDWCALTDVATGKLSFIKPTQELAEQHAAAMQEWLRDQRRLRGFEALCDPSLGEPWPEDEPAAPKRKPSDRWREIKPEHEQAEPLTFGSIRLASGWELDDMASAHHLARTPGESDGSLRQRLVNALRSRGH
jgi:hypothetical protein